MRDIGGKIARFIGRQIQNWGNKPLYIARKEVIRLAALMLRLTLGPPRVDRIVK